MANLATKAGVEGHALTIQTPLLNMHKADIIKTGTALGVDYALTISCYQIDENAKACGKCDSCRFRHKGFVEAGIEDPTPYRNSYQLDNSDAGSRQ
jgi:7-cyano-7-deazaguanine synthase